MIEETFVVSDLLVIKAAPTLDAYSEVKLILLEPERTRTSGEITLKTFDRRARALFRGGRRFKVTITAA